MIKPSSRAMHYAHLFARQGTSKSHALARGWRMVSLRTALARGIIRFRFVKTNGDVREAKGTLHPLLIPADKAPKGTGSAKPNFSTIPFFDLDKQDWRAFRITDFETVLEAYQIKEIIHDTNKTVKRKEPKEK